MGIASHQRIAADRNTLAAMATGLDIRWCSNRRGPWPNTAVDAKFVVRHAASVSDIARAAVELDLAAYPLLVQQRVVGPGVGIFLLVWHGQTLATFAHRRIREKPPAGGVSVYREGIAADPELVRRSRALLDAFGWCGVAMVEYKIDARTSTPYLMEVNGRFWGSLQLAIDSGSTSPHYCCPLRWAMRRRPSLPTDTVCEAAGSGATWITSWPDFGARPRRCLFRRGPPAMGRGARFSHDPAALRSGGDLARRRPAPLLPRNRAMAPRHSIAADGPLRIALMLETDGPGGAESVLLQLAEESAPWPRRDARRTGVRMRLVRRRVRGARVHSADVRAAPPH